MLALQRRVESGTNQKGIGLLDTCGSKGALRSYELSAWRDAAICIMILLLLIPRRACSAGPKYVEQPFSDVYVVERTIKSDHRLASKDW